MWKDAAQGYARVAELDKEQNDIVWLTPSPANNTWAIALRQDVAEENGLTTMTQMGEWIAGGGQVKLAASTEFVTSPAALPAFQETYGFTLTPDQLVQLAGGDTAATIAAAAQQTSGVNAAMVYGTDGAIAEENDPESFFTNPQSDRAKDFLGKILKPVYQPAPIVRAEVLEAHPQIAEVLEPIFASLTLQTLQTLNGRIQVGGEPAAAVAQDYLTQAGFLD